MKSYDSNLDNDEMGTIRVKKKKMSKKEKRDGGMEGRRGRKGKRNNVSKDKHGCV